jgi:opacity protein-like surface antigen
LPATHPPAFAAVLFAALFAATAPAHADGILGAFIGTNFGGQTEVNTRVFGGVLGGVQPRGVGFEIDFGYSPDFFDTEEELGTKTSITTVMGNLVIGGASAGGVAPYGSGGIGLIRANISEPGELIDDLTSNDFGMNIGGGVNVMFSSNAGVRGDLRYFRRFEQDEEDGLPVVDVGLSDFDFWRATVGVVLRW